MIALYPILCKTVHGYYFQPSDLVQLGSEDACGREWDKQFVRVLSEMKPILIETSQTPTPRENDERETY